MFLAEVPRESLFGFAWDSNGHSSENFHPGTILCNVWSWALQGEGQGLREVGAGTGRVRNVQQVVLSGLVLIALLSWPKAY